MRIPTPYSAECFTRVCKKINAIKAASVSCSSLDLCGNLLVELFLHWGPFD